MTETTVAATPPFVPRGALRNAHLQSLLASSAMRAALARRRYPGLLQQSRPLLLDGGGGVRLTGALAEPAHPRGLAVLLHGWEGSIDSGYMLATGGLLHARGYAVARINFRDHGDSHHLNPEPFHSCRLDEVVAAVGDVVRRVDARPRLLIGFSLGGNFALRVASDARAPGFDWVLAVCPPLEPRHALDTLEQGPPLYGAYFLRKWTRSLRRKARLFPDLYPDESWFRKQRLRALTARLVERYTHFGHLDAYLDGYSLPRERLRHLRCKTTIVAAADDPVIPVADFDRIDGLYGVERIVHRSGGHCGFIEDFALRSWVERFLDARLVTATAAFPQALTADC